MNQIKFWMLNLTDPKETQMPQAPEETITITINQDDFTRLLMGIYILSSRYDKIRTEMGYAADYEMVDTLTAKIDAADKLRKYLLAQRIEHEQKGK